MWNEITNEKDAENLLSLVNYFHDSCIKEILYVSGAYVTKKTLSMYPVNDQRSLKVILQRQEDKYSLVELEFTGLKFLKLSPADDQHTCEIFNAHLLVKKDGIYWTDCEDEIRGNLNNYNGTLICSEKLRWRYFNMHIGDQMYFNSLMSHGDGSR